ncbi:hypothetical protein BV25DRAFT_1918622 [Artomyces pyxidatus]|uniref:Uncharacterized protein n=1 Tax=Artomyces pyxidatus TaxID=48021 RepID=A0ACB8SS15_9AGAM|nr:hypothetical protein BV25DRAFT_1918622 [Artomyces pyxidatus]
MLHASQGGAWGDRLPPRRAQSREDNHHGHWGDKDDNRGLSDRDRLVNREQSGKKRVGRDGRGDREPSGHRDNCDPRNKLAERHDDREHAGRLYGGGRGERHKVDDAGDIGRREAARGGAHDSGNKQAEWRGTYDDRDAIPRKHRGSRDDSALRQSSSNKARHEVIDIDDTDDTEDSFAGVGVGTPYDGEYHVPPRSKRPPSWPSQPHVNGDDSSDNGDRCFRNGASHEQSHHGRVKVERQSDDLSGRAKGRVMRRSKAIFAPEDDSEDGRHDGPRGDDDDEDLGARRRWPEWMTVNNGPDGWPILKAQDEMVAEVLSYPSATEMPKFVCFVDAFPLADDRIPLYQKALVKGAKFLKAHMIKERLEVDVSYVERMAIIPKARVSILRGKVWDKAAAGVKMHYQFASYPAQEFTSIIAKLLEGQRYIYPGDHIKKTIEEDGAYCHAAIIATIYESFFGGEAIRKFPEEYYPISTRTKHRQLPKSMVVFAATANDAALKAYQMGPTAVKVDFRSDHFDNIYSVHLATLDKIRDVDAETYNGLMTYLYKQVTCAWTWSRLILVTDRSIPFLVAFFHPSVTFITSF